MMRVHDIIDVKKDYCVKLDAGNTRRNKSILWSRQASDFCELTFTSDMVFESLTIRNKIKFNRNCAFSLSLTLSLILFFLFLSLFLILFFCNTNYLNVKEDEAREKFPFK